MRISQFRGGKSTFICECCKRRTRETNGDHAQTGLCAWCFDLAGIENTLSDNGAEQAFGENGYYSEAHELLKKLRDADADMSNWQALTDALDAWDRTPSDPACIVVTTTRGNARIEINFDRTADVCWSCTIADCKLERRGLSDIMIAIAEYIGQTEF